MIIKLEEINGNIIYINILQILYIKQLAEKETYIVLITNKRFIVKENPEVIMRFINSL